MFKIIVEYKQHIQKVFMKTVRDIVNIRITKEEKTVCILLVRFMYNTILFSC